jgi:hypothetical protein
LAKFHIDSIQVWEDLSHEGNLFSFGHLSAHEVSYPRENGSPFIFIVTYGLHCFTKDGTDHNVPVMVSDGRETQTLCVERYESSKNLPRIIKELAESRARIYETTQEKYFTVSKLNNLTGEVEPYKICIAVFKEKRRLRIHVLSAFFVREGPGSPGNPVRGKGFSIFKVALDASKRPKRAAGPKEVRNMKKAGS